MSENKLKNIIIKSIKEYLKDNSPEGQIKFASIVSKKASGSTYLYSLKILDQSKEPDINYPVVPNIPDEIMYNVGDIVIVGILYGQVYRILKKVKT